MWYILYMNKDVIYIEPEDDITDIIVKIENSKEKIVALVPPKKAGVFRSVVNIKLIAKSGASSGKTVVLVTTDPSIMKLAGASKLPVTKNLQSAPSVPEAEAEDNTSKEDLVEKDDEEEEEPAEESSEKEEEKEEETEEEEEEEIKEEEVEKDEEDEEDEEEEENDVPAQKKKGKKSKAKSLKSGNKFVNWIKTHKVLATTCGCGGVLLILLLVWALVIAPAATITVGIKTDSHNFSENVTFVEKLEDEKAEEGTFFLDEKKIESEQEVKFEATGKKNVGEKASGELIIYHYFPILSKGGKIPVNKGSTFTISGLSFKSTSDVSLMWDGDLGAISKDCENYGDATIYSLGCLVSGKVAVEAAESGTKYNISAAENGWSTTADVSTYSNKAMSGGTDEEITIVTQSDIDKAKAELVATDEAKNKEELLESITGDVIVISSSFNQSASEVVSSPAVNEEVKDDVTPTLKATTKSSIYVIDKTKVEEFITSKANLGETQKIYEIKDPFVENFSKNEHGFTGKLKTSYLTGPKITENDVIEKVKGKGLGEAQHDLRDISGVSAVTIDKSVPWIMSVPGNPNKITVIFEVRDQNGNEVKEKAEEKKSEKEDDKKESNSKEEDKKE